MSDDTGDARAERARSRAAWPIRRHRLGDEPAEPAPRTSVDERLADAWRLSCEVWAFSGQPWPAYTRDQMPGRMIRKSPK